MVTVYVNLNVETQGQPGTILMEEFVTVHISEGQSEFEFRQEVLKSLPQLVKDFINKLQTSDCVYEVYGHKIV